MSRSPASHRRDFLTGRSLQAEAQHLTAEAGDALLQSDQPEPAVPQAGPTIRLGTRAMACDFHVILNDSPNRAVETWFASDALQIVHRLEDQMTIYRERSELIDINRQAALHPVTVEPRFFDLLAQAREIALATDRAYDPTTMPLVRLWRQCRTENRIPSQAEVDIALASVGIEHVELDVPSRTVRFDRHEIEIQLNAIGKGHALDRAAEFLRANNIDSWILHGGHSSVLASGDHYGLGGWPVGIRNPIFPDERLGTVLLRDQAMGTSGNSVQYFRYQGKRYGHILDPRTGWPADELLSATVLAPTAAEADAISTAFFVMGLEKAREFCQNHRVYKAFLIPPPRAGRTLEPINCGIPEEDLFLGASSR